MSYYLPAPAGVSSPGVAPDGLKGQYLRKASDIDFDTEWVDIVITGGGGGGGTGVTDGNKGDIVVSNNGLSWVVGSLSGDVSNSATGFFGLPRGTTAQRTNTPVNGYMRYNTSLGCVEAYVQSAWQVIANTALDYGLITNAATATFDYGGLA